MRTGEAESERKREVPYDECFTLLSNHRRRYTLYYIEQNGDSATIGELADQIAAWENGTETDAITHDERKRVYTSLQQVHLPRMDEEDVIEFDDREGVVERGPAAGDLDIYLEAVGENDSPWSQLYLGLAVLNTTLVATTGIVGPDPQFPFGMALAAFAVTTFFLAAAYHHYRTRRGMRLDENGQPPTAARRENGG